jgi:hypothetical protein
VSRRCRGWVQLIRAGKTPGSWVMPGVHTYTVVVHQAGHFKWICAYPCDPYSMANVGYMQGCITAT